MQKVWILGLAPILFWLTLACSGSDSGPDSEPLNLEQYFTKLQAIFANQERQTVAIDAKYADRLETGAANSEEAFEAALTVLPDLLAETLPVLEEALLALEELEPPVEVVSAHEVLLRHSRDMVAFSVRVKSEVESGAITEETLSLVVNDSSAVAAFEGLALVVVELQAIADTNGIDVVLSPRPADPDHDTAVAPPPATGGPLPVARFVRFESSEFGFSFEYLVSPGGFGLREGRVPGSDLLVSWSVIRLSELDALTPNSEGPPGMTIEVYEPTPGPASAEDWVLNSGRSNIGLGSGTLAAAVVDSREAVAYGWSGLYEGRSIVVLVDGRIWVFSATFRQELMEIESAFRTLLDSVIFE